jgi:hypothetical protein
MAYAVYGIGNTLIIKVHTITAFVRNAMKFCNMLPSAIAKGFAPARAINDDYYNVASAEFAAWWRRWV